MPTSKSKKKQRKEDKQRPYRIDYFLHEEMLKDRALVRSAVTRATTAEEAKGGMRSLLCTNQYGNDGYTIIRAYRFYKKLSAEPKKKTYIEIAKLLPAQKAIDVMTAIENRKFPIVIRPEDLNIARPEDLPPDHPDHVCSDDCYGIVELKPEQTEYTADSIKVLQGMDRAVTMEEAGDPANDAVFGEQYHDEGNATNHKLKDCGPQCSETPVTGLASYDKWLTAGGPCRWHGGKYTDSTGRCTALDPGSDYLRGLYAPVQAVVEATVFIPEWMPVPPSHDPVDDATGVTDFPQVDLNEVAPVIDHSQFEAHLSSDPEAYPEGQGVDYIQRPYKVSMGVYCGALIVIVGLVYVFFKYLVK